MLYLEWYSDIKLDSSYNYKMDFLFSQRKGILRKEKQRSWIPAQAIITETLMSMFNNYSIGWYFLNDHTSKSTTSSFVYMDEEEDENAK